MKRKKIRLLIYFFIIILIVSSLFVMIDFNQRVKYERVSLGYNYFDINEKEGRDLRIKSEGDKTYVYISIGEHMYGREKINFKITKLVEEENKIVIYVKETGHCSLKKLLLPKMLFDGRTSSPILNVAKTISIEKTDKPIEIVWQNYISC